MCLQTTWKKPRKATKNIKVYKLVELKANLICAPYEYFIYELNKIYSTEMEEVYDDSSLDGLACEARYDNLGKWISIGPGFHSALLKERLKHLVYSNIDIAECIIPEGALYYIGFTDLVVSNKIKLIKLLKECQ